MYKELNYIESNIYVRYAKKVFKNNLFYESINNKCDKIFTDDLIEKIIYKNTYLINNHNIFNISYLRCLIYECAKNHIFNIVFKESNKIESIYEKDILKVINNNITFFQDDIKNLRKYIRLVKKL